MIDGRRVRGRLDRIKSTATGAQANELLNRDYTQTGLGDAIKLQRLDRRLERGAAFDQLRSIVERLPAGIDIDPSQRLAALEVLRRSGKGQPALGKAMAVLLCPHPDKRLRGHHGGLPRRPCKYERACPRCADRRARRSAAKAIEHAHSYAAPVAVLVTCHSTGATDLRETVTALRAGVRTLLRRLFFKQVCQAGVIAIETTMAKTGAGIWTVHGHGILDVALEGAALQTWATRLQGEWAELVQRPEAVYSLEPLRDATALITYGLKVSQTKSWAIGLDLSPAMRGHLDHAMRGKRLIIEWGGRRPRKGT